MSASCVGTCTACGRRTFWLSSTLCLQLDDGSLKCLRHPGEAWDCEQEGLTLGQASGRGRLFGEQFFVCRHCGRNGSVIERRHAEDWSARPTFAQSLKMSGACFILAIIFGLLRWWTPTMVFGITALVCPLMALHDERRTQRAGKGLPRPTAPGAHPIPPPTRSIDDEAVVGTGTHRVDGELRATGPCCDHPDWMPAYRVRDEDRIPCCACHGGVMTTSEHAIH